MNCHHWNYIFFTSQKSKNKIKILEVESSKCIFVFIFIDYDYLPNLQGTFVKSKCHHLKFKMKAKSLMFDPLSSWSLNFLTLFNQ